MNLDDFKNKIELLFTKKLDITFSVIGENSFIARFSLRNIDIVIWNVGSEYFTKMSLANYHILGFGFGTTAAEAYNDAEKGIKDQINLINMALEDLRSI